MRALHHSGWCTTSSTALTSCVYQHHLLLTRLLETTLDQCPSMAFHMAILIWILILPHQLILYQLTCGSCLAPSPISSLIMDQATWSWDAPLITKSHMLLTWISQFNPPIHSIHVDHGIHTIFSQMMAAMYFLFAAAPPFAFIKPRLLSTNKRFWFANPSKKNSITYDRYVPTPGPMSNIGLMIYAIFVRMDSRELYVIRQGVKDTWFLLMLCNFVSSCPSCWLTRDACFLFLGHLREHLLSQQPFKTPDCRHPSLMS